MMKTKLFKKITQKISLLLVVTLVLTCIDATSLYASTSDNQTEDTSATNEVTDVEDTDEVDEIEATDETEVAEEEDETEAAEEADKTDASAKADNAKTDVAEETEEADKTPDSEELNDNRETVWNVYIYMIGGKTESSDALASENIREILAAKKSDDVRILLQAGGAKEWHLDDTGIDIDENRTQRYIINGSDSECVYDRALTNMAEMTSLCDFLTWGVDNYPSEKSLVIIYGDGKGFLGLGTDEMYGDYLSLPDIAGAFDKSGLHTDILAFDASFMADLDVMNTMSPYADYMISSEGIMADEGFDYTNLMDSIIDNTVCRPTYISKRICDSYFECSRDADEDYETLSIVNLSKIDSVIEAVDEYIDAITNLYTNEEENAAFLFKCLLEKGDYANIRERDLKNLTQLSAQFVNEFDSDYAADFEKAKEDVEEAVINSVYYRVQGKNSRTNTGIALAYCFASSSSTLKLYEKVSAFPKYIALLDALKYNYHPDSSLYEETSKLVEVKREYFTPSLELEYNEEGFASLVVSRGLSGIATCDYCISETDNAGRVYTISERSDLDTVENNKKYLTRFDGTCSTIEGQPVVMIIDKEDEEGALYNIPVLVENEEGEGENCYLLVSYEDHSDDEYVAEDEEEIPESDRYSILGMHKNSLRNPADKTYDIEPIKNGTVMRAAYPLSSGETYKYGEKFIFSSDSTISLSALKDGEYELSYYATTGLGKTAATHSQTFFMKDGNVYMSDPEAEDGQEDDYAIEEEEAIDDRDSLPIVSYKEFYGTDVPDRLRDIHYDIVDTSDVANEDISDVDIKEDSIADGKEDINEVSNDEVIEKADVTMLMYICGANLENAGHGGGSDTLRKSAYIPENDKVNLVSQTGGADRWAYKGLDVDSIQRFEAHEDTLVEVTNTPAYNMSTATAFSEFLNWGINNYPAEHYVVYIYDHGGAWFGTSWDENFDSSNLTMKDWAEALESTGVIFDEVIYDVCMMSTVEVASVIAPYVKYMTAYEESQMSINYEWESVFNYLINHSDNFDAESFGKMLIDMNADAWEEKMGGFIFQTMALIDLSKIDALNDALSGYADELNELLDDPKSFTKLVMDIEKSRHYSYSIQKDIVDMMNHSEGVSIKTRQKVINAVDDAVVYKRTQFDQLRNNGLTIYFNLKGGTGTNNTYADLCPIDSYVKFLDRASVLWHGSSKLYDDEIPEGLDVSKYRVGYEIINDNNQKNGIRITDNEEALYQKSYQVLEYDEEQGTYYAYTSRSDFTKGDNGEYYENFDGRVASIDGVPCYMKFDSFDGDRIIYKVPVYTDGTMAYINVAFYPEEGSDLESFDSNPQNGTYEIIGVTTSFNDLDVPEKNKEICVEGDPIYILLPELNKDGEELSTIVSGVVNYSENMKIRFVNLDDGEYVLRYTIENGLRMTDVSEDQDILIKDGRISTIGNN